MVMRCTRLSRYSAVISPADSSRSPLVILPIIVCSRLLMARPPSRSFHHANGLALRARDRPRREQRDLDVQSQRGPQPRRHLAPELADFRVIGLDAAASLQERRRRLHLDLDASQGGGPVDDQQVVGHEVRDRKSTRLNSSHSQISYAVFCLKKKKKTLLSMNHRPPSKAPSDR